METVSGQSLDEYFRANIFEPLGMTDTFFNVPVDKQHRVATQHVRLPDGGIEAVPRAPLVPVQFLSGGGGLYSTASDFLRFARALLADGQLDGRRVLRGETVAMMAQNQLGELTIGVFTAQDPQLVAPGVVLPGGVDVFGLGFGLNREPLESRRGAGTMTWAGLFNTYFWIDREKGVCAALFAQMLPFGDPGAMKLVEDFERGVYQKYGEP